MKFPASFRTRFGRRLLPLAALSVLPFAGCVSSDSISGSVETPDNFSWKIVELHGQPLTEAAAGNPPTLLFDTTAQRVSGFAGVNRFSGPYTLTGAQLSFGALSSTRMAGPPEAMKLESDYLKTLASVTS